MQMAASQEDGDQKLRIFAYFHIGVTTLSITIGLYSWYCFIYRNKHFACQWPFKAILSCEIVHLGPHVAVGVDGVNEGRATVKLSS